MWSLVVSAYMRSQKKFQTGDHKKDKEENELFLAFAYSLSDLTALFKSHIIIISLQKMVSPRS